MKYHRTAGGVLFHKDKVYLIHKRERDEWLLPKGHIEDGEGLIDAAKREIREETGYTNFIVLGNEPSSVTEFRFKDGDKMARKKIHFFPALLVDEDNSRTKEMDEEGLEGGWFTIQEALGVVEYDDVAKAIQNAYDSYRSLSNS